MATSRNWEANVIPDPIGRKATLFVTGEINTGGIHEHPKLERKIPQGINPAILQLNTMPISEVRDNFVSVSYSEDLTKDSPHYTSIEILNGHSGEHLHTIEYINRQIQS